MPVIDGIEFLKRVRASGNTVPFIIFTGRGREEIVIQALNEGADFYLQKGGEPVSQFAELGHKIQKAILQRRAEASVRDHERREADIINFLPDATFAIDTRGVVIAWNRAMERMTGVPADADPRERRIMNMQSRFTTNAARSSSTLSFGQQCRQLMPGTRM